MRAFLILWFTAIVACYSFSNFLTKTFVRLDAIVHNSITVLLRQRIRKGKTTNNLKPPSTKKPFGLGYLELYKIGSGEYLRQKKRQTMKNEKLWQTSKIKTGGGIKSMKSRTQKRGYSKCVNMQTKEGPKNVHKVRT